MRRTRATLVWATVALVCFLTCLASGQAIEDTDNMTDMTQVLTITNGTMDLMPVITTIESTTDLMPANTTIDRTMDSTQVVTTTDSTTDLAQADAATDSTTDSEQTNTATDSTTDSAKFFPNTDSTMQTITATDNRTDLMQTFTNTDSTTDSATGIPCNVTWDVVMNGTLKVKWSGDLDGNDLVMVNATEQSMTDTTREPHSTSYNSNFSTGFLELLDLYSNTNYLVGINFQCTINETYKTLWTPPERPSNVIITNSTNSSLSISWTPPPGPGDIVLYLVKVNGSISPSVGTKDTTANLTFLRAYTYYAVRVSARNKDFEGMPSEEVVGRTKAGIPDAPKNLNSTAVSNTTVDLKWEEPGSETGPIKGYRVQWRNSNSNNSDEIDTLSENVTYTVKHLTPYVEYTFKVLALTDAGPGNWSEILMVRTDIGVPHAPQNLEATKAGNTTVDMKWDEPGISTGPIVGYRVIWRNSSGSGEEDTLSKQRLYTLKHLTPYVAYTLRVLALTKAGPGEGSRDLKVRTTIGVPHAPQNLEATKAGNTTVDMKWDEPGISTGPIVGYRVIWRNSSGSGEEDTLSKQRLYTLKHLTPYVAYTLRVLALTKAGPGEGSRDLKVRTTIGVPHSPMNLKVNQLRNTTIDLQWDEPEISTGPIIRYRVQWSNSSGSGEEDTPSYDTRYTLKHLTPYVNYTLRVLALTKAGPGKWSLDIQVRTTIGVPHLPTNLKIKALGNTTIDLQWNEPKISTGPILRYRVQWSNSSGSGEEDTLSYNTVYTLKHLIPYVVYTLRVLALTEAGPGEWSQDIQVRTNIGVPHLPTNLKIKVLGNTTIDLQWNAPEISTGPILRYRVQWSNSSGSCEENTLSYNRVYTLKHLTPYVLYTLRVLALTEAGPGEWSRAIQVRTKIGVPHLPTNLKMKALGNTTIDLQWNEPEISTGPILRYRVQWSNSSGSGEEDTLSYNRVYTLKHLTPYVVYTLRVLALTEAGPGEWSRDIQVRTKIGVPHLPTNLKMKALGNTTIDLQWNEPEISTGPILRYRVQWSNSSGSGEENTLSFNRVYTLKHLTPYVLYTLKVLALTEAGPGEWSRDIQVRTKIGVPQLPTNQKPKEVDNTTIDLTWDEPWISTGPILLYHEQYSDSSVPHLPTNLKMKDLSNTTIDLQWDEPEISTGPILRYRVQWSNSTGSGEEDTLSYNKVYTLKHLTPYVVYTLRVLALTEAGPGEWSKDIQVRTKTGVPHPPQNFSTTSVGNTTVDIQWDEPGISTGPILGYRIQWSNSSGSDEENTKTIDKSYRLKHLTPYVEYIFKILALTEAGPGEWSRELKVRTDIGVPHPPTHLLETEVTNGSVFLTWQVPEPDTGPLLPYTIRWSSERQNGITNMPNPKCNVTELLPYLEYTFEVRANTKAGGSRWSRAKVVRTDIGVPSVPRDLHVEMTRDESLHITWTRPEFPNAPNFYYRVIVRPTEESEKTINLVSGNVSKESSRHAITGLLPYTRYTIQVSAVTGAGEGPSTPSLEVRTAIGEPRAAVVEEATPLDSRMAVVRWKTPGPFPGPVVFSLQTWKYPDPCSDKVSNTIEMEEKGQLSRTDWGRVHISHVTGLFPYGNYFFLVRLKTSATDGISSNKSGTIRMPPAAPSEPLDVTTECQWSPTKAKVSWRVPKTPNGRISSYYIQYGIEDLNQTQTVQIHVLDPCLGQSYVLTGLRPERRYRILVGAKVEDVKDEGRLAKASGICELKPGVPTLGNVSRLLVTGAGHDSLTLEWTKDVFSDYMGTIVKYAILVGMTSSLGNSTSGESTESGPPWSSFSSGDSDYYQATPPKWNPFEGDFDPLKCEISWIEEENDRTILLCTVGLQRDCPENQTYCNGPLEPDTQYEMKIRAFTGGGYTETLPMYARTGPAPRGSVTGAVVAVVLVLLLLLGLAMGGYVLKKKGRLELLTDAIRARLRLEDRSGCNDPELQMERCISSRCIKTSNFADHVNMMMSDSHLQFSEEFEALKNESPKLPCTDAETEENRLKNRWMNIFPFDHSRVKLLPLCDEPGSDFINANYIPGFNSPREYIASQGPLPQTVDDFWRMVWEQTITTIVMLTQCVERGKKKCEQYWPEAGEAHYYGDLVVGTVSESMLSSYIIRVFHLKLGSYERRVKQLHFTRWPDFGCPESPEDLINFVNAVRDHMPRTAPGPILVHCSAGVGRTGTFIAVDRLSRQLRSARNPGDDTVDIYSAVLELRHHRTNMVQTEDQYIYIHLCVRQLIRDRDDPGARECEENIYSNMEIEKNSVL